MNAAVKFPYLSVNPALGAAATMPLLPLSIRFGSAAAQIVSLVDSGATNNVLPYQVGLQLGANWNRLPVLPSLGGILSAAPCRLILVEVEIVPFPTVILSFAWSMHPSAPLLLGQTDFFDFFDVCFHRSQGFFEIAPRP